ncbi:amidohydrolase family protein [Thermodesulfobacteriota bacterium]
MGAKKNGQKILIGMLKMLIVDIFNGISYKMVEKFRYDISSYYPENRLGGGLLEDVYKERVYIDTLAMHVPTIKCAWEFMGTDHILFGTDYPHRASGTVEENMAILDKVGFTDEEKQKIYSKNAKELFGM